MASLEQRVDALERSLGRTRGLLAATVLTAALAVSLAATPAEPVADVVRAHRVEVLDNTGRVRVSLDADVIGQAAVDLFDEAGTARVRLVADPRLAGLEVADANGHPRLILTHLAAEVLGRSVDEATLLVEEADGKVIARFPRR